MAPQPGPLGRLARRLLGGLARRLLGLGAARAHIGAAAARARHASEEAPRIVVCCTGQQFEKCASSAFLLLGHLDTHGVMIDVYYILTHYRVPVPGTRGYPGTHNGETAKATLNILAARGESKRVRNNAAEG